MNVSGKPPLFYSPLGQGFTVEAAKLVLANTKPPAKGFQPLLASWVHEKVKNYTPHVQIPNPVTHCFTEQEAKQLALMTECKEREKKKSFSRERSSEGNFITRLQHHHLRELPGQVQWHTGLPDQRGIPVAQPRRAECWQCTGMLSPSITFNNSFSL